MEDPKVIAAIVSALVALAIGAFTFFLNLWRAHKEIQDAERKVREEIEVELIKRRIECYEDLMQSLRPLSSQVFLDSSEAARKSILNGVIDAIQTCIFGKFGLISSHEARETVLRLRAKCRQYLISSSDFEQVRKASWEVHQMLRSDLGLAQPNLLTAIDRLRKAHLAGTEEQIEDLLDKIHHNKWESK